MADRTIFQVPVDDTQSSVVELGDGSRRYRKQLVKFGAWANPHDPSKKMVLDKTWGEKVIRNFKDKVLNKVPVVEGHPKNSAELLSATRGWLESMSVEDDGVYGELEVKVPETAQKIDDGLFDDVSISFDPDYLDKLKSTNVGPALLHVGIVNDAYLKGMQPFQALSDSANVIMLSEIGDRVMSKVTNDREFPVKVTVDGNEVEVAPGAEVEVPEAEVEAVTKTVAEATKPEPTAEETAAAEKAAADKEAADKAEADAKAAEDANKTDAEKELDETKQALADANTKIALGEAEATYDKLLHEGKIVPAQKDAFISLSTASTQGTISLADGATTSLSDLLTNLFKASPKRVNFGEDGAAEGEAEKTPFDELSDEEKKVTTDVLGVSAEQYNETHGVKVTKQEAK